MTGASETSYLNTRPQHSQTVFVLITCQYEMTVVDVVCAMIAVNNINNNREWPKQWQ